jgi:hypothetical protein
MALGLLLFALLAVILYVALDVVRPRMLGKRHK